MDNGILNTSHPDQNQESILNHLITLLNTEGHNHFEEMVSQYRHAVQTAHLAKNNGANSELIAAALLHDIGHLLVVGEYEEYNEQDHFHEDLGADFLAQFLSPAVTEPIRMHVLAKRYLVSTRPEYYDLLSDASRSSYYLQGGPMSQGEIAGFEEKPHYKEALLLRIWDDQAKDIDAFVPPAEFYQDDLRAALSIHESHQC